MEQRKIVTASAPGKLLLLGDHAVVHGFPCLVTAVNYRVTAEVTVSPRDEFVFPVNNGSSFVMTAIKQFREQFSILEKVKIVTRADYAESYGLGSSSAVTVAVVKVLAELFGKQLTNQELFDLCYEVVLSVQSVGSGFDIAAAIWGGTLYFVTGGKKIEPLPISELPLVVAYSGSKGNTPVLVTGVALLKDEKPELVDALFSQSQELVEKGKTLLAEKKYTAFGELMNENHVVLQQLGVSTPRLDELVSAARDAGAYGAKLSGAGGGDCVIAFVPDNRRSDVEKALTRAGGTILSVTTNEEGVQIE
jgi:mevalonate kinase